MMARQMQLEKSVIDNHSSGQMKTTMDGIVDGCGRTKGEGRPLAPISPTASSALAAVEDLLARTDPNLRLAADRTGKAVADGGIEHVVLVEGSADVVHHRHRIGRRIE
jgi:hypothetical protein